MAKRVFWVLAGLGLLGAAAGAAAESSSGSRGQALVFGDWHDDKPGVLHHITVADLPQPFATGSAANPPRVVQRPKDAVPMAPPGFRVALFAHGFEAPRIIRTAPNGDLFVAESGADRIRVLRPASDGKKPERDEVFASGLTLPFGIAFYPAGPDPKWVYVAENNRVVRFAYKSGNLKAEGKPEVIVPELTQSFAGHATRDIAFSKDGALMFVSVGSASNDAEGTAKKSASEVAKWQARHALGEAWGFEEHRADVLVFTPEGGEERVFATGIRNCVGLSVQPETGDLYCSTNERDGLGDNLPPDYVTRVKEGGFYGWPWFYIGDHQDPRWKDARLDLAGKITIPDVLLQPHSAPLGMSFYDGAMFPAEYRGSAFDAFHGSWNRSSRTGYKVVRILMRDGVPTGEYEDFLTGFVLDDSHVWGRPVGVTAGKDGSLFVTEDGNGTIWRVTYQGSH